MANDYRKFSQDEKVMAALKDWHASLDKKRGDRAELRRAKTPEEAGILPAALNLYFALRSAGWDCCRIEKACFVAGILAHAREHVPHPKGLAGQMAEPKAEGGDHRVTDLRFRRFLANDQDETRYRAMIRLVRLLDAKVDIIGLADAAYFWGPAMKQHLALAYYEILSITEAKNK